MNYYFVNDLSLVTALSCYGIKYMDAKRNNTGKYYFLFEDTHEFRGLLSDFTQRKMLVEPREYQTKQREIKKLFS